jgi:hypothetical protein
VESGDTTYVFLRQQRVQGLDEWSDLSGDIRVSGVRPSGVSSTLGYLTLGDVEFRNQILVGTSRKSDGSASFSYVETFRWEKGVEAILEVMVAQLEKALLGHYRSLPDRARGEIVGLARARFQEAVEDGVFDDDDAWDDLWDRAIRRTATQGIGIVREWYPEAEIESFRERIDLFGGELEEDLDTAFIQTLPGLNLALSSEVTFRLTMPGEVTSTNAHRREEETLVWEFSPGDALTAPVMLMAESQIRQGPEAPGPSRHR